METFGFLSIVIEQFQYKLLTLKDFFVRFIPLIPNHSGPLKERLLYKTLLYQLRISLCDHAE